MSNRLLRRVIDDLDSLPLDEVKNLINQELEENSILESLLDNIDDAHIVCDEKKSVVYANSKAKAMNSYTRKKNNADSSSISSYIFDDDIVSFINNVFSGKEKSDERDFTIQIGSEMRVFRVGFAKMETENKKFVDIYIKEITDTIRKETRLRRSESLASMTTMAAGVAHEIKNPLAAMTIHLQLMRKAFQKKGQLTLDDVSKYLNIVEEEIEHLNKIAVDFLFAVKPLDIELKKGNINSVIKEVVSFIEVEAREKNIEVESSLYSFLPSFELDERLIKQALLNIIQNGIAAMENGGKLVIKSKIDGDYIRVEISDTGIGIPQEKLAKIFEPYYTTKASGTGLGLTLVYKIIKEHSGEIHVLSEKGKGTSFVLLFPIPVSERKAIGDNK